MSEHKFPKILCVLFVVSAIILFGLYWAGAEWDSRFLLTIGWLCLWNAFTIVSLDAVYMEIRALRNIVDNNAARNNDWVAMATPILSKALSDLFYREYVTWAQSMHGVECVRATVRYIPATKFHVCVEFNVEDDVAADNVEHQMRTHFYATKQFGFSKSTEITIECAFNKESDTDEYYRGD